MTKADSFTSLFNPYRSKFTRQVQGGLFGESWSTEHHYLSKSLIQKAILERLVIGYFVTNVPHVLGVDIDDHQGKGWPYLLSIYDQVRERLRNYPSLLVQSPHGLHAYWIFSERIAADILYENAKQLLKGLPVEIKPTPTTALRIPSEKRILDPETLQLMTIPFEQLGEAIQVYHPSMVFDESYLPSVMRNNLQSRRASLKAVRAIPKIEKVEAELLPFTNGYTNDKFLQLCLAYRMAGLDVDQAFYRFTLCLMHSPGYTGDLRNAKRLLKRIQSEYRNNQRQFVPSPKSYQVDLFDEMTCKAVVAASPFAKQRRKPIERFVTKVLLWCGWHDEIIKNPRQTAVFDYLYPYYRKNRREGLYPLPKSFLRKANDRWFELMPWLQEIGFLEPSGYPYVPKQGICTYYRVHRGELSTRSAATYLTTDSYDVLHPACAERYGGASTDGE